MRLQPQDGWQRIRATAWALTASAPLIWAGLAAPGPADAASAAPAAPPATQKAKPESSAHKEAMKALNEKGPRNYSNNPVNLVVNQVQADTQLDYFVDWSTLAAAGVKKDARVSFSSAEGGASSKEVLDTVLGSFGPGKAAWGVDSFGIVIVSTPERVKYLVDNSTSIKLSTTQPTQEQRASVQQLVTNVPVNLPDIGFINALTSWSVIIHVIIKVDSAVLDKLKITSNTRVTLQYNSVPPKRVIDFALDEASGGKLAWGLGANGTLYIGAPATLQQQMKDDAGAMLK